MGTQPSAVSSISVVRPRPSIPLMQTSRALTSPVAVAVGGSRPVAADVDVELTRPADEDQEVPGD